jgi:hypothetical protein
VPVTSTPRLKHVSTALITLDGQPTIHYDILRVPERILESVSRQRSLDIEVIHSSVVVLMLNQLHWYYALSVRKVAL